MLHSTGGLTCVNHYVIVGIAVTADILLILGALGAIYDIINGAIQRDKLRDSINKVLSELIGDRFIVAIC